MFNNGKQLFQQWRTSCDCCTTMAHCFVVQQRQNYRCFNSSGELLHQTELEYWQTSLLSFNNGKIYNYSQLLLIMTNYRSTKANYCSMANCGSTIQFTRCQLRVSTVERKDLHVLVRPFSVAESDVSVRSKRVPSHPITPCFALICNLQHTSCIRLVAGTGNLVRPSNSFRS